MSRFGRLTEACVARRRLVPFGIGLSLIGLSLAAGLTLAVPSRLPAATVLAQASVPPAATPTRLPVRPLPPGAHPPHRRIRLRPSGYYPVVIIDGRRLLVTPAPKPKATAEPNNGQDVFETHSTGDAK